MKGIQSVVMLFPPANLHLLTLSVGVLEQAQILDLFTFLGSYMQ